jgi:hypothetical protein
VATDLLFDGAPFTGQPVNLVFGDAGVIQFLPATLTHSTTLGAPAFSMVAVYDNRVTRWRENRTQCAHQVAQPSEHGNAQGWGLSRKELGGLALVWQMATPAQESVVVPAKQNAKRRTTVGSVWQQAEQASASAASAWQTATQRLALSLSGWQVATQRGIAAASLMEVSTRYAVGLLARWQVATQRERAASSRMGASRHYQVVQDILVWQLTRHAPNGRALWPLPTAVPPGKWVPDTHLLFQCPPLESPWVLRFGAQPCYLTDVGVLNILPSRFYMTINTVKAELLPSLAEVPLYPGCTISQDVGSYGWTLSATGPASIHTQLARVSGLPKQLRVTINCLPFVFAIDAPRKTENFGKTVTSITGRSVTAAVGPSFARETSRLATSPYSAQQLAAQALENTGITLDWGLEDWLVPAGAWSHYGTPLAAVQAIAQAAGGYVQSHRNLPELQVRHPYPLLPGGILGGPWNWGGAFAADVSLAPDAIVSRSTEVRDIPALNAVYVSGTTQGVLALIKREGTAGELLGAQISDALITANVAARQRGLAVLGPAGSRVMHQLELPVLVGVGQPGILSTDQLIQVNDAVPWRGRVRAVSVTGGRPSVRQTVLVEAA